ncbi:hypothetical protein AB4581_22095 [Vibrio cyclitrophicus]|nr:hypothetical protein [Vibrio parahaemolyticus]
MSSQEKFIRTDDDQKRCNEIHDKFREELLKRQLSNNEGYDKAILSLSSAGLALSLTAIRFIVPLESASYLWALKTSWVLFLLTVISTLVAYLVGNKAISKQLDIAEDYYIKALVSAQVASNPYQKINTILNRVTGLFFSIAISLVVLFVIINIKSTPMSDQKITSTRIAVNDSADLPRMQLAPSQTSHATASADIPTMQMAPGTQTTSSGQSSAGNGNSSSQSKGK